MQHLRDRANNLYLAECIMEVAIGIVVFVLIGLAGGLEHDRITCADMTLAMIVCFPIMFGLIRAVESVHAVLLDTYDEMDACEQRHIARAMRGAERNVRVLPPDTRW